MKNRKQYLLLLIISILSLSCQKNVETRPNILFIFPDQFRNFSLGFWSEPGNEKYLQGNPDPVNTPSLDKLAHEGIVLNRAQSNYPLCSPYRGMLLSGMYPNLNGISSNCRVDRTDHLRSDLTCLTDVFSTAGYNTAYIGKCHWIKNDSVFNEQGIYCGSTEPPCGYAINRYDTYVPPGKDRHSIEYFYQVLTDSHYNPRTYSSDPIANGGKPEGEPFVPGMFSAELESMKIMDYLENTHGQRNTDKPFLLLWSLNPPHNPWDEANTHMLFFDQYTDSGSVNLDRLLTHENADHEVAGYAPYYFANVSAVDHFIGKVLDKLDELGIADNTIIVFSSDHGEMLGSHGKTGKNVLEVESCNIPFIIKWKNKIQHSVNDLMFSVPDVMPTLLGLAGLESLIPESVQGVNYSNAFLNPNATKDKPKSVLLMNFDSRGVYSGKYTFVVQQQEGKLLDTYIYDNVKDPNQLNKLPVDSVQDYLSLKNDLVWFLKNTQDEWYEKRICADFLNYDLK